MIKLFVFCVFILALAARHHHHHPKIEPTVFSWEKASSIPKINSTFHKAHSLCKYEFDIVVAYTAILICEANELEIRCDADKDVMLKVAKEETVTVMEIEKICFEPTQKKPEFAVHCKSNVFITMAELICDLKQHEKEVEALTKFAMETTLLLPISLERIKTEKGASDEEKWRLMRSYLDYHPRYLWGAFITRENQ